MQVSPIKDLNFGNNKILSSQLVKSKESFYRKQVV